MISVDRETVAALREHHRRQSEERLAAGTAWTDSGGLVFVSKWGEPLYPDTVTALMTKLINSHNKAAPEPGHRLPHARRMIFATCTPPLCCSQASLFTWSPPGWGHADPSVTLRVYSHVLREHAQGIGDVFAQAIKASVSKSVSNGRNDS